MANKHSNLSELFAAIADAIRTADDSITGNLIADDFPDIIANIETGIDTTETANPATDIDIRSGKIAYVNGVQIEGKMSDILLNAPTITVGTDGIITATITQSTSGYLNADSKSSTTTMLVPTTTTFTPTTSEQTIIAANTYCPEAIKISAIPTVTHATPTASIDTTNKRIVATHTQSAGYITSQSTKTGYTSIDMVNGGNTITPNSNTQTAIAANTYAIGAISVGPVPSTYKQVATGTITATTSLVTTITISGLGFTPTGFLLTSSYAPSGADSRTYLFYLEAINTTAVSGYIGEQVFNTYQILSRSSGGSTDMYVSDVFSGVEGCDDTWYDWVYDYLTEYGADVYASTVFSVYMNSTYGSAAIGATTYYMENILGLDADSPMLRSVHVDVPWREPAAASGTATYSNGTISIALNNSCAYTTLHYVAWG